MKSNCVFLLVLLPFFFLSMTCRKESDGCHYSLWLNNTTNMPVYVVSSYDYPDTSINFQNPLIAGNYVSPHTRTVFISEDNRCIEDKIEMFSPGHKLSIFVFEAERLHYDTSWAQIRQNYQVLKRYDYTADELRNTNFSIDF
ncbi:hypothetical protein A4D02_11320 [Niastella koreensis]|uniref:Lipoprotein n=2 Tax=Niastella koreensis TaxID=354356 RepID=G8T9F8_NIAKG|nr:hypothetical protein [Niastella koreensis]AEV99148.1 hypothetical protein Niako_2814 [Niastella koreensis GR20-10]OQP44050.1 hypothetical protein A4D02_11320 [Niastella koreensis]